MRLNLGAADRRVEGFISVDIAPPADQLVDLSGPWPWAESSVEEVLALDVIEHIGAAIMVDHPNPENVRIYRGRDGRIAFMNSLHRVLKPGARATIETPNASRGCGFYQDPTHVSPWCLSTFKYFEHGAFAHTRLARSYGITAAFKIVSMEECKTGGEFGVRSVMGAVETAPLGVWIPAQGEVAWKIRAVLEAVK